MIGILTLLGIAGTIAAVTHNPSLLVKKKEEQSSSSGGSLSVERMWEVTQGVMDRHLASYYAPKPPSIINNHYNFTTIHNHITVHNHNTYNYFDHCSFKTEYNFLFNKCPHCGK